MTPEEAEKLRKRELQRRVRRMQLGYDGWKQRPDGSFWKHTPKGIQHWHDTKTLVKLVTEKFESYESDDGVQVCHINGRHQLQIRGKHLRRLLKAMPDVKQVGRKLVREKKK